MLGYTETPLVFVIGCPKCSAKHFISALGVRTQTIEGVDADIPPTLSLQYVEVNNETGEGTVTVLCGVCQRDFQFRLSVVVPDEGDEMLH